MNSSVGIIGFGTHSAAQLVKSTGIPEEVLREKTGIRQRHVADGKISVTTMASEAAKAYSDEGRRHEQLVPQTRKVTVTAKSFDQPFLKRDVVFDDIQVVREGHVRREQAVARDQITPLCVWRFTTHQCVSACLPLGDLVSRN